MVCGVCLYDLEKPCLIGRGMVSFYINARRRRG
nr:MAG TPA: hypothetical protein [Caudoviricetes sp.]